MIENINKYDLPRLCQKCNSAKLHIRVDNPPSFYEFDRNGFLYIKREFGGSITISCLECYTKLVMFENQLHLKTFGPSIWKCNNFEQI